MVEGHDRDEINAIIDILPDRDKSIVCSLVGIQGMEKKRYRELAREYGVSQQMISFIYNRSIAKVRTTLSLSENAAVIYAKQNFYHFSQRDVEYALVRFSKKLRMIVCEKLGLNGMNEHSTKWMAEKYGVDESKLTELIVTSIDSMNESLVFNSDDIDDELYELIGKYGLNGFDACIDKMEEHKQKLLFMYYGIYGYKRHSFEELLNIFPLNDLDLCLFIESTKEEFSSYLNKYSRKEIISQKKKMLKSQLVIKGSFSHVKKALEYMDKEKAQILSLYYGLDGVQSCSKKEIGEMLDMNEVGVDGAIKALVFELNSILVKLYGNKRN
jgi:hypothetical protein